MGYTWIHMHFVVHIPLHSVSTHGVRGGLGILSADRGVSGWIRRNGADSIVVQVISSHVWVRTHNSNTEPPVMATPDWAFPLNARRGGKSKDSLVSNPRRLPAPVRKVGAELVIKSCDLIGTLE